MISAYPLWSDEPLSEALPAMCAVRHRICEPHQIVIYSRRTSLRRSRHDVN